jgi:CHAD domain-containing protein
LPLYTTCIARQECTRWRKHLRRLTRALGPARDIDVQLDVVASLRETEGSGFTQAGLERVLVRLQQQRQAVQPHVLRALQRFLDSEVPADLERTWTQVLQTCEPYAAARPGRSAYRTIRKAVLRRLTALEKYAPYVQQPEHIAELHAMRIAAKRLRYTLQAFAPLYAESLAASIQAVHTLQDLLGDIHDCDVWATQLPPFLEAERARTEAYFGDAAPFAALEPGIMVLQQNRARFREQRYQSFVTFWQQSQEQGIWEQLRQALDAPLRRTAETGETSADASPVLTPEPREEADLLPLD